MTSRTPKNSPRRPEADPAPTPPTAAQAKKNGAGAAAKPAAGSVKYRCASTGMTWSGRGLQPAWVRAALKSGKTLDDLLVEPVAKATGKGPAGLGKTDDDGCAVERDTRTADMFEA